MSTRCVASEQVFIDWFSPLDQVSKVLVLFILLRLVHKLDKLQTLFKTLLASFTDMYVATSIIKLLTLLQLEHRHVLRPRPCLVCHRVHPSLWSLAHPLHRHHERKLSNLFQLD